MICRTMHQPFPPVFEEETEGKIQIQDTHFYSIFNLSCVLQKSERIKKHLLSHHAPYSW